MQPTASDGQCLLPQSHGRKKYSSAVDLWSIGVITFMLLAGYPPFYADNDTEVLKKIVSASYDLSDPIWKSISGNAQDLVRSLLVKQSQKRLTAVQALQHRWATIKMC